MEYTIQKLGQLAGVSNRTLRYYDEIGLLKPARINSSGYRIYGAAEVDRLQQILFFRALDFNLESILKLMNDPNYDQVSALETHLTQLEVKRKQLDQLIQTVNSTIHALEGGTPMSDKEKFEGLKKQQLDAHEAKYGTEIREKYGKEAVEASNQKFMNMTQEEADEVAALSEHFMTRIKLAFEAGDPASDIAQEAADLHRQWLCHFWPDGRYSKEAHYGLAQMYVEDSRFTAYYDHETPGLAAFLKEVIRIYCGL